MSLLRSELWVAGGECLEGVRVKAKCGHAAEVVRACLYELKRISANHNSYRCYASDSCRMQRMLATNRFCVQHLDSAPVNGIYCRTKDQMQCLTWKAIPQQTLPTV